MSAILNLIKKMFFNNNLYVDFAWKLKDGKKEIIKQEIEEVNEENHKIVFKVLEARLVENIYKSFKIIFHVEPKGDGKLAAVTFEFEKVNPRIPYPTAFMDYLCDVFKGVDDYNSSK
ncbi:putative Bet v I/Major latex protein [Helianthus annuus]|nr:putative Bet v I/Major latex protein [Helianthus annuus]